MSTEESKQRLAGTAQEALAALRRARLRAERLALATGTYLVDSVDGKTVLVAPRPEVGPA